MFISIALLLLGLPLMVFGADLIVRSSSGLSGRLGMSGYAYGLTVVALATNSPELATLLWYGAAGNHEALVGEIVGSNLFNLLAILGGAAVFGRLNVHKLTTPYRTMPAVLLAWCACYPLVSEDLLIGNADGLPIPVSCDPPIHGVFIPLAIASQAFFTDRSSKPA